MWEEVQAWAVFSEAHVSSQQRPIQVFILQQNFSLRVAFDCAHERTHERETIQLFHLQESLWADVLSQQTHAHPLKQKPIQLPGVWDGLQTAEQPVSTHGGVPQGREAPQLNGLKEGDWAKAGF